MAKIQQVSAESMQSIRELDALGYSVDFKEYGEAFCLTVVPMDDSSKAERFVISAPTEAEAYAAAISRVKEGV